MFDNRMPEDLEWIQLDLDTLSNDVSTHGLIIPVCHQIEAWEIDKLLGKTLCLLCVPSASLRTGFVPSWLNFV